MTNFGRIARSGRVGQPVFFRCVITSWPALAEEAAAVALAAAVAVIGDRPRTLFARGEPDRGNLHALLDFFGGATALVAVGPGEPGWDAMLLGNHGAAYLDSTTPSRYDRAAGESWSSVGEVAAHRDRFQALLRQALAADGAVPVGEIGDE
jgi:hypothetical protein